MSNYTACVFLNLTSVWPTHPPLQVRREFVSRTKALAWARMGAPEIPYAEPDVLVAGGPPGEAATAVMVYPSSVRTIRAAIDELGPAPAPQRCETGDRRDGVARLEMDGLAPVWLCDHCLRDRDVIAAIARRLLARVMPAGVSVARRTLH